MGTDSGSWLAIKKQLACCHSRKVRGYGILPLNARGESRMRSVSPQVLILSALL